MELSIKPTNNKVAGRKLQSVWCNSGEMINGADETVIQKGSIVNMKLQPTWHRSY